MVIDKVNFHKFLKLLSLRGDTENKEALANFKSDSLEVYVGHISKFVVLRGRLKGEFEAIG